MNETHYFPPVPPPPPSFRTPSRIAVWLVLPAQFFGGGAILGTGLSILSFATADSTFDGGLAIVGVPLACAIFTGFFMIAAFILGLPLRLVKPLRHWWVTKSQWTMVAITLAGLAGITLAYLKPWATDVQVRTEFGVLLNEFRRQPHPGLFDIGLLIAAFGLCNFMPQRLGAKRNIYPLPNTQHFIDTTLQ